MNAFWTAMFAAAAAVSFTLASVAVTQGQDKVQPSFDCTKSVGVVEKAICGSEDLSRLDGDMSVYFKLALKWLSGADAAALRADQRAWLSTRQVLLDTGIDSLKAGMQERIAALQGTVLNAFPLLGEWVNHATSVLIRDRGGLIVEFRDEHCGNLGGADYAGAAGDIVVHTGEDDKAMQTLRFASAAAAHSFWLKKFRQRAAERLRRSVHVRAQMASLDSIFKSRAT